MLLVSKLFSWYDWGPVCKLATCLTCKEVPYGVLPGMLVEYIVHNGSNEDETDREVSLKLCKILGRIGADVQVE